MVRLTKKVYCLLSQKQRRQSYGLLVLMLVGGIMESLSVSLVLPLITAITEGNAWNNVWYAKIISSIFKIDDQRTYIEVLLGILIFVFIMKNIYLLFEYKIQYTYIANCRYTAQSNLMEHYMSKAYNFYLNASSGEIVRILTVDTELAFLLLGQLLTYYTELIVAIVLGITIIIMSPGISCWLIFVMTVEMAIISKIIKPKMRKYGTKYRNELAEANRWSLQGVNGIKSIKVTNSEKFFSTNYAYHAKNAIVSQKYQQILSNMPRLLIEAFTVASVFTLILILVLTGTELISIVPQLSAFVMAAIRLLPSVNRISVAMNSAPFQEGAVDNIIEVIQDINVPNSIQQKRDIEKEAFKFAFSKTVEIKNLSFSYDDDVYVLEEVDFVINKGSSIGIIGTSGAGKTTIVDIMLGLLNPQIGEVLVDGVNIQTDIKGWRECVAYIPQQIFLSDDTIKNNVAFGIEEEEIDEKRVMEVLDEAQLGTFVNQLKEGIDTVVGEQGVRLSGGQRQRIGIARALYNNPDILFFDEATSALDNDTENEVMEALEQLKGRKTLIIIAHRLSTIKNCDLVYKVENKKIVKCDENIEDENKILGKVDLEDKKC